MARPLVTTHDELKRIIAMQASGWYTSACWPTCGSRRQGRSIARWPDEKRANGPVLPAVLGPHLHAAPESVQWGSKGLSQSVPVIGSDTPSGGISRRKCVADGSGLAGCHLSGASQPVSQVDEAVDAGATPSNWCSLGLVVVYCSATLSPLSASAAPKAASVASWKPHRMSLRLPGYVLMSPTA